MISDRHVMQYNNLWYSFAVMIFLLSVVNSLIPTLWLSIPITILIICMFATCYFYVRLGIALKTIHSRKHSLISMRARVFFVIGTVGIGAVIISLLLLIPFYSTTLYIISSILFIFLMTFIYCWNTGIIRHLDRGKYVS